MAEHRSFAFFANSGGCPQNQLDGAQAYAYLSGNGYTYTSSFETADVVVINSCAYSTAKENESYDVLQTLTKSCRRDARIILAGCLSKIAPDRVCDLPPNVSVIPGAELHKIGTVVPPRHATWEESAVSSIPAPLMTYVKPGRELIRSTLNRVRNLLPDRAALHFDRLFMYDHSAETFIVSVAKGCLGGCAYCAIRFSRGILQSRPVSAIVDDVRRAVRLGVKEIMLAATDLAAYGRDRNTDLAELLREILSASDGLRLLLFYANPRWLIDIWPRLEPIFATQRIHFIHLSLNGGSDRVLRAMKRGYSLGEFEALVRAIKRVSPGTVLQTQVITGFPGESEEDFADTVRFFQRNYVHNVQVHAFDARPGTLAIDMPDQVPLETRQRRRKQLYRRTLAAKLLYDAMYVLRGFRPPKAPR